MSCLLPAALAAVAAPVAPPVRVALMDFSTDDNSWRSAQVAANFTSLLQIQLAAEPEVEWVERAQLELAKQELKLSEMELIGGASPIRRGKWAKADWLVTGQFSLDDKHQRTLALEVTDLQHADVLASRTITFPGKPAAPIRPAEDQVAVVATAVRQLLAEARRRQQATADQVIIAPLFVVDLSMFGRGRGSQTLERDFYQALERAATTNPHIRFIRFPKAYRAMDEAEMVLDGLVEADPQAWRQTADLYVWGTYARTTSLTGAPPQTRLEFALNLWDGTSRPHIFRENLPVSWRDGLAPEAVMAMLNRMVNRVLAHAHRQEPAAGSEAARQEVAKSIGQGYRQLAGAAHLQFGLHDEAKLVQGVHMLETACFFDPDNADLQVMRITCRYGWWMDFQFKLKNPFWSYWRRSRAWGRYVDRFGLQPTATPLPFPYQMRGIPGIYVRSLEEVLSMFPERYDPDEEQQQQTGVHTTVMEAQGHGFPKEIPREVALKWKAEVEATLAARKKQVSQYTQSTAPATNSLPNLTAANSATPPSRQPPASPAKAATPSFAAKPAHAPQGTFGGGSRLSRAQWFSELNPQFSFFKLSPPAVLPADQKPDSRGFQFPPQFEVRAVLQLALCRDKLLILALDERSAPSSDPNPDLSAELRSRRGRLWSLPLDGESPALFEPGLLPGSLNSFLLENERLWVAGATVGCLELKTCSFRQFGLHEGLTSQGISSLAFAGGHLFATGDAFRTYQLEPGSSRWRELKLPPARLSSGTGNPCLIAGHNRWLGYLAGSVLLYDVPAATWTNLQELKLIHCLAADASGFWFGGYEGLRRYDLDRHAFESWQPPTGIQGLSHIPLWPEAIGQPLGSEPAASKAAEIIERFLKGLQKERTRLHLEKANKKGPIDPLHLGWRLPSDISALAHDGDFLWLGTFNRVLLIYKPTRSLVACCPVEGNVSSLAVSERELWVGTAYGRQLLTRMQKQPLLAIPRSRWVPLAISADERAHLVNGLPVRDQAKYAFYAGDDARVAHLLRNVNPDKATLEEMFLLAFAYDATGLDKPDQARAWFERIGSLYPDSPWATTAAEFLAASDQAHKTRERQARLLAKYDRNRNGVLDEAERRDMERDPDCQREAKAAQEDELDTQLRAIFKKFDLNGDGRLDSDELERLRSAVSMYSHATPQMLAGRTIPVAPLLSKRFPSVESLLKKYDTQRAGGLDAAGLKAVATDLQKKP